MTSENDLGSLVERIDLPTVSNQEDRPYILLDGILRTAHNTLINIAIGRAAHKALGLNVGYLCRSSHPSNTSDRLFQKAGIPSFEMFSNLGETSFLRKVAARLRGYAAALGGKKAVLDLVANGVLVGDLVYDSIIRENDGIHTIDDASIKTVQGAAENAIRREKIIRLLFEQNDIKYLVLSHKVFSPFGIPARVATDCGTTLISKSRAHLNRVSSFEGHLENDYVLSKREMNAVVGAVGKDQLRSYVNDRFEGNLEGADVQFAFADKVEYEVDKLRSQLASSQEPLAVITPHAFSDAPHCDREMIYSDYYEWFVRVLELTKEIDAVSWAVKPHPSSSLYNEEGVVEELVQRYSHVQLVPAEARTDSVLRAADAVLTVRGTIGMEALLFDCQVILAGNAIYEAIDTVDVNLTEASLRQSLRSIDRSTGEVPTRDKWRALGTLFYRDRSYNYVSPIFGPERPPGFSAEQERKHDRQNLETFAEFQEKNEYEEDRYYQELVNFFQSGADTLSILDLIE